MPESFSSLGFSIPLAQSSGSNAAIIAFMGYMCIVMFLAWLSSRVAQKSSFLKEYFLGGRNLGVWAFALTFAATSASGGSFIGFPSKVYTHGWSLALWIGSYMLVPLVAMGLLAKRLNQIARKTDAITIPDLILERFRSPTLGLFATLLIVFFTTFNLIAQFKGGSVILQTLLSDVPFFQSAASSLGGITESMSWTAGVDPAYLLCLGVFAFGVVIYTTYGGFRAVVWTDVLQGFVMVLGILVLLPMTLIAVGGLRSSTNDLILDTPTTLPLVSLSTDSKEEVDQRRAFSKNARLAVLFEGRVRTFRLAEAAQLNELGKLVPAASDVAQPLVAGSLLPTDLGLSEADRKLVFRMDEMQSEILQPEAPAGSYVSLPGPAWETRKEGEEEIKEQTDFLPFSAAISFFFFWCLAGAGQPSNMVRCIAFRDSKTLSKAIFTVSVYYSLIYFPIVIIFCCARTLLPGMEAESDRIMPEMASTVTSLFGVPWLAGLLVAAPFAAVMSTMDSSLLLVSSSVIRDIYVRWIQPDPTEKTTKILTYGTTFVVGILAMIAAINPPQFLQDIIVFTGSGLATAFLMPVTLALYWPRFNSAGALAGMMTGFLSNIVLYGVGYWQSGKMQAWEPFGLTPFLFGLGLSAIVAIAVCLLSGPPSEELVLKFFYRRKREKPSSQPQS